MGCRLESTNNDSCDSDQAETVVRALDSRLDFLQFKAEAGIGSELPRQLMRVRVRDEAYSE